MEEPISPASIPSIDNQPDANPVSSSPIIDQPKATSEPEVPTTPSLGAQPAMQDQIYNAQANDPGAFKIPGL
jgi:hypothetical protein